MPVLHEYAPSSKKDGYYMRDSYDGQVVTYQLTNPATNILRALKYDDEDQVPNEIFLLLYNLRLIYTHRSGVEPAKSIDDLPDLGSDDEATISEQTREKFYILLHDHENLSSDQLSELEHYAKSYQIQSNASTTADASDSAPESDQTQASTDSKETGVVDFFNDTAGYGFIETDASDEDVFYHMEDVSGPDIHEDEELSFNIIDSDKGPRAINVERIDGDADSDRSDIVDQEGSGDSGADEPKSEEVPEDGQNTEIYLSKAVVLAAKASLENGRGDAFSDQLELWSRNLIAVVVKKEPPDFVADIEPSDETVPVQLPEEIVSHIELFCKNPAEPFDDPNHFVEVAIRDALGLGPGKTESVTVEVPVELVRAAEMSEDVEIDAMVEEAIENVVLEGNG